MLRKLTGRRVAILATSGVEEAELTRPRDALRLEGALVEVVSIRRDSLKAWNHGDWGSSIDIDLHIDDARADDYDALVLPGGVMNPDALRTDPRAVRFLRHFMDTDKPVAAICHGAWLLIEAAAVAGSHVTSYPSLRTDLTNAKATWTDEQVVIDGNLITSRRPDDLTAFCYALVEMVWHSVRDTLAPRREAPIA